MFGVTLVKDEHEVVINLCGQGLVYMQIDHIDGPQYQFENSRIAIEEIMSAGICLIDDFSYTPYWYDIKDGK